MVALHQGLKARLVGHPVTIIQVNGIGREVGVHKDFIILYFQSPVTGVKVQAIGSTGIIRVHFHVIAPEFDIPGIGSVEHLVVLVFEAIPFKNMIEAGIHPGTAIGCIEIYSMRPPFDQIVLEEIGIAYHIPHHDHRHIIPPYNWKWSW